jgi:hypothetical protein
MLTRDGYKQTKTVLFGVSEYSSSAQKVLNKYANANINNIKIVRKDLSSALKFVLDAISLGDFKKRLKEKGYDKLYHLSIIVDTNIGRVKIEKNEVITLSERPTVDGQTLDIIVNKKLTIPQLLQNAKKKMGSKYFSYNALNNNCQDFIMSILESNHLSNKASKDFIKQDVEGLFNKRTQNIVNTTTETASRLSGSSTSNENSLLKKGGHYLLGGKTTQMKQEEPEQEEEKPKEPTIEKPKKEEIEE